MSATSPYAHPVPAQAPDRRSGQPRPNRRNDARAILAIWAGSIWLSLFVTPHTGYASLGELLYYSVFNVAVGAFIGFHLFDRLPRHGFPRFAFTAGLVLASGTILNEAAVEPFIFEAGRPDGEGLYYGLTDSLWAAAAFLLLRFAQWQRAGRPPVETAATPPPRPIADAHSLFVRVAGATRRIDARDILWLAAERDFTRIHCTDGAHFASEGLKALLARAGDLGLVRIHKSYAVSLQRVERLARAEVQLGPHRLPVGRRYRPAFAEAWCNQVR